MKLSAGARLATILATTAVALSGITSADAAFTADGLISFDTAAGIHAMNKDGSGYRMLVERPGARNARWSPNGRYFAYEQHVGESLSRGRNTRIMIGSPRSTATRAVARGNSPAWLTGGMIAYHPKQQDGFDGVGEVLTVNVRSRDKRRLTRYGSTAFSPNRRLAVYRNFLEAEEGMDGLMITDIRGKRMKLIPYARPFHWGLQPPGWLGNRHIFHSCNKPGIRADLCFYRVKPGRLIRLGGRKQSWLTSAALSPSGRHIAWSAMDGIYLTNSRGRNTRALFENPSMTGSNNPMNVQWQPRRRP